MEKKTTLVTQPDKTEATKPELVNSQTHPKKMYREHAHCDHLHGRINKFPFGSSHGPAAF